MKTTTKCLLTVAATAAVSLMLFGCGARKYDPNLATRPYPVHLHQPESVDIQVFRKGVNLELVNATARSYRDFDLWVNQRYVRHIEKLAAGESIRVSLWGFRDERGEVINAGGFWRTDEPTPVRMVQIQMSEDQPLVGLVTIRSEDVVIRQRRR